MDITLAGIAISDAQLRIHYDYLKKRATSGSTLALGTGLTITEQSLSVFFEDVLFGFHRNGLGEIASRARSAGAKAGGNEKRTTKAKARGDARPSKRTPVRIETEKPGLPSSELERAAGFKAVCVRFVKLYYDELRAILCPTKPPKAPAGSVVATTLATYLAQHFHLDSGLAAAFSAAVILVIFQCTKGAFCKMTKDEFDKSC